MRRWAFAENHPRGPLDGRGSRRSERASSHENLSTWCPMARNSSASSSCTRGPPRSVRHGMGQIIKIRNGRSEVVDTNPQWKRSTDRTADGVARSASGFVRGPANTEPDQRRDRILTTVQPLQGGHEKDRRNAEGRHVTMPPVGRHHLPQRGADDGQEQQGARQAKTDERGGPVLVAPRRRRPELVRPRDDAGPRPERLAKRPHKTIRKLLDVAGERGLIRIEWMEQTPNLMDDQRIRRADGTVLQALAEKACGRDAAAEANGHYRNCCPRFRRSKPDQEDDSDQDQQDRPPARFEKQRPGQKRDGRERQQAAAKHHRDRDADGDREIASVLCAARERSEGPDDA